jgi:hypothetical protein
MTESIQVIFQAINGSETKGVVRVKNFSPRETILRAAKGLGFCWLLALASVLVPIAHFVLVPLFLLAGPIWSFILFRQKSVLLGGEGECPKCKNHLKITKGNENWPLKETCPHCLFEIGIVKAQA